MNCMEDKVLSRKQVEKLGFDKLSVITTDMLDGFTRIGDNAFDSCTSLTSIEIPNSVTNIGNHAFESCSSLTSVTIPNSVTSIGGGAFYCCNSLTSVMIPNSVTSIWDYAFANCSSLTSIEIPNSVTSIGNCAFEDCSSITSITVPNSVTSIGKCVFYACNKLKKVIIGDKLYDTQEVVNCKCKAYKAFNSDLSCRGFHYEEGKTYEIEDKPKLCKHGFHACLNIKDVFGYYYGELGKNIVVHEVELEGVSDEYNKEDSKVAAKKITIGKRIL